MAKLLLVRHGKTVLTGLGQYYGKQDIKLSDEGIQQANMLRKYLMNWNIDHVYSSTLSRAIDTANIVVADRGHEILQYDLIDEIDVGLLEGLTFSQIELQFPELAHGLANWQLPDVFPEGESLDEFSGRVSNFASILKRHTDDETILIVAHAGSLRSLICHYLGLGKEYWMRMFIDFTSLSIVDTCANRAIIHSLNDISHLDGLKAT